MILSVCCRKQVTTVTQIGETITPSGSSLLGVLRSHVATGKLPYKVALGNARAYVQQARLNASGLGIVMKLIIVNQGALRIRLYIHRSLTPIFQNSYLFFYVE